MVCAGILKMFYECFQVIGFSNLRLNALDVNYFFELYWF